MPNAKVHAFFEDDRRSVILIFVFTFNAEQNSLSSGSLVSAQTFLAWTPAL